MSGFEGLGRILITIGVLLVLFGLFFVFWQKVPFLGKLPGDFFFQKGDSSFYFPLVSSLIASLVLTILLNIIFRIFK